MTHSAGLRDADNGVWRDTNTFSEGHKVVPGVLEQLQRVREDGRAVTFPESKVSKSDHRER